MPGLGLDGTRGSYGTKDREIARKKHALAGLPSALTPCQGLKITAYTADRSWNAGVLSSTPLLKTGRDEDDTSQRENRRREAKCEGASTYTR